MRRLLASAARRSPASSPAWWSPAGCGPPPRARAGPSPRPPQLRRRGRARRGRAAAAPLAYAGGAGPDFTRVAGQAVKGVANISSLQVVRTPNSPFANDPFFRYFFGDDDDCSARAIAAR